MCAEFTGLVVIMHAVEIIDIICMSAVFSISDVSSVYKDYKGLMVQTYDEHYPK